MNKHHDIISSATFSPNGQYILTCSYDSTAKLWDLGGELIVDLNKYNAPIFSALFSPDGQYILTYYNSIGDNTAKLWDLAGNLLADLDKHTKFVRSAIFSSDGKYILTVSDDGTAKLWPTPQTIYDYLNQKPPPLPPLTETELVKYGIKQE